jgi:hypothetical protein
VIQSFLVNKHVLMLSFALAAALAAHAQNVIGDVFSGEASVRGSVLLSGNGAHVLSGSQVTAGEGVALLKLERGGQLLICPKTNLSLSADAGGKALVIGLNAGSMELNYSLAASADSLITPDFRLQLISPGTFHFAISVSPAGDTCLRSLAGNDASVFVAEMMGNDSYQLSPGKNVMFRGGKISGATGAPADCGCVAVIAPKLAETPAASPEPANQSGTTVNKPPAGHMEVDSAFVFRGDQVAPDPYSAVSRLSVSTSDSKLALALLPKVTGPEAKTEAPAKKPGIFRRLGGALGRLFGR